MELQDYLNLITSEHRRRPRFMATASAVLRPVCGVEELLHELRLAFDLDTAVGAQLDAVGVRVGRSRYVRMPINTYFSWDTEKLGWNEAYWRGKYDPASGMTRLPDDLYRLLLYGKVAANSWDGTIPGAYAVWEIAFAGRGGVLFIQDNQDMSMIVGIAGIVPDEGFIQLLLQGYIPLKPEGVRISWFALLPGANGGTDGGGDGGADAAGPLFAWDCDSDALSGWQSGSWPRKLTPITNNGGDYAAQ